MSSCAHMTHGVGMLPDVVWTLNFMLAMRRCRNGKYISAAGQSFREFMEGRLPALPGEFPTKKDWEDHLTTIFPEVGCSRDRLS